MISALKPTYDCYRRLERLPMQARQLLMDKAEQLNAQMDDALLEQERAHGLAWLRDAVGPDIFAKVAAVVCHVYVLDIDEFVGLSRSRCLVDGRKAYSHILRAEGYTYQQIGAYVRRDHTTIIHYVHEANDLMQVDKRFSEKYKKTLQVLKDYKAF